MRIRIEINILKIKRDRVILKYYFILKSIKKWNIHDNNIDPLKKYSKYNIFEIKKINVCSFKSEYISHNNKI